MANGDRAVVGDYVTPASSPSHHPSSQIAPLAVGRPSAPKIHLALVREDRKTLGEDIKTVQFGWLLGMPLIRKLATGLWEMRSHISTGIARVMFTVDGQTMVLLHGVQKKSQRTPPADLMTAKRRLAQLRSDRTMKKTHIGSTLDDLLKEDRLLEVATARATKRVIAHQIAMEMKRCRLTKMAMASRMKTSRAALDRLLDPNNPSVTIGTLEKAAAALNRRLTVELR